ncbi:hypothetical protein [Dickeya zeae]|jgi:hypothetical protein|uniref:hypothetical protein n=1 Tax=Dickeya zeae TaxID=204042 RepID=UPI001F41279E|nr:hypothetical protein [Dickeya zeae]UJR63912.1 hypothetical protein HJ586_17855 [Dickeya zeae]
MLLKVFFPDNLLTGSLIEQNDIPCMIKVSEKFELVFSVVEPVSIGVVERWDRDCFEKRTLARAGGEYTHYEPGLVTLNKVGDDIYKISDLSIFYNDFGWCPILINGDYAEPYPFWDSNDDDPGYIR